MFKVGDKVKSSELGEGTIIRDSIGFENAFSVDFGKNVGGRSYNKDTGKRVENYGTDSITLIPEAPPVTFKVGDRVKLKEKFYDEPEFKALERGFRRNIADVMPGNEYRRGSINGRIPESILELANPVVEVVAAKQIEPKVGMWAEITQYQGASKEGQKGTVVQIKRVQVDGTIEFGTRNFNSTVGCYKLLPDYVPLRKWTDAEIQEAKAIVAELIYVIADGLSAVRFNHTEDGGDAYACYRGKHGFAHCCKTDEWNIWIGRMVAMSKATGRELPVWIKRGAK